APRIHASFPPRHLPSFPTRRSSDLLPTANPDPIPPKYEAGFLKRAGARNIQVLPGRDLKDVEDPKNLEVLRKARGVWFGGGRQRSEEHTSELQSQSNLVCRLLLEKK